MQPGKATEPPAEPRPFGSGKTLGWLKTFGWPLLCLFQLGLIAGAFRLGGRLIVSETPETVESSPNPEVSPPSPDPTAPSRDREGADDPTRHPAARGELDEVDRLVRVGRYELALTLCRSFCDRAAAGMRDAFRYRLALCLEGLGHWDEALLAYRGLASRTESTRRGAIALLGQARVWLRMRRPAESKALLCDLIRRSSAPHLRQMPFLPDARYLLALAGSLELLPNERPGPFNHHPVGPLSSDWSLERALDWDAVGATPALPAPSAAAEIIQVQPGGLVRIEVQNCPLPSLLDRLAEKAALRIDWTPRARQQVEGRSVVVALDRVSLADALRVLAEPMGLLWKIQGGKLALSSEEEATPEAIKDLRLVDAQRALREAVTTYQRHPLTPAAFLVLGDLEALVGRLDEAAAWYSRLIREWPRSPLAVEAQYNIGLMRHRQQNRPAARQAFYRVVDRAPAHELTPLAYWRIGRLFLDEGDPVQALSPLRRALGGVPGSPARAAATLTIAAAHLLNDNPRAAHAVLLEHRQLVAEEHYRPAAAFLDTLSRFRAAVDRRQRQREAGDLLAALLAVRDDPLLGYGGMILAGQAFQELGMREEMIRSYEKVLPYLRGQLATELSLSVAEAYWAADKRKAAVDAYRKLLAAGPSSGARRARLRLAEIALAEKNPQDCLKGCRELLQEKSGVDVAAVLRMMAAAYEQLGQRDKAIRCLSGELPP